MAKSSKVIRVGQDAPHQPDVESESSYSFVEQSKRQVKVKIQSLTDDEIVFDLIGVDAAIANALRRILLAEVPTMAIEHVYIWNNSSIIQDEVLAHRLGLAPLNVDPREFQAFPDNEEAEATDENTIVFKLDVTCKFDPEHPKDPTKAIHSSVEECQIGLFDIEDIGGVPTAVVKDQRACTMCRNCIREPSWNEKIRLGRQSDHFIFSVESVGMIKPEELLLEALNVLAEKCNIALESFTQVDEDEEMGDEEEEEEDQEE
ncbi:hypothetical protein JG688_00008393 [Phytophthora aleatoria]|uniref:DNA-directed RNA polymerase RpoA/D/Rpb3-type domain-containing protein n=1 Tax=Phytophthora aleatoria TaxID=2496075 RepID=A0A8J5MG70_9STRA|nr:hypothetical protein JG688_00008393 [Phytophthora aleatoria]